MSTLSFGNLPVDMRATDFGIANLQAAIAILDSYEPVDVQLLAISPNRITIREVDAQDVKLMLDLSVTGSTSTDYYVSSFILGIESIGFYAGYIGSFVFADSGDFYGTADAISSWYARSGEVYADIPNHFIFSGLNISINGDSELNLHTYLPGVLQGNDEIRAGQYSDYLLGFAGDDVFSAGGGDDAVEGGSGTDAAVYQGLLAEHLVAYDRASHSASVTDNVADRDGVDWLSNVERLHFEDLGIAFDIDGPTSAGGIYRLYQATLDRVPDLEGLGYWIKQADSGESSVRMGEDFTWSAEFQQLYGVSTHDNYLTGADIEVLVTGFYQNVLHRTPDQGGLDYYVGVIESQEKTVGRVLAEISDSPENYAATVAQIEGGIQYVPWLYMLV